MIKKLLLVKILICVIFCFGIFHFLSSFYRSSNLSHQIPRDASKDKLLLDVYMETKCPDTELFVAEQLVPAMRLLGDSVTLTLYPYGKAHEVREGDRWVFTCQHGPSECQGNTILGCVISMTNQSVIVPYTACLMRDVDPLSNYKDCCQQFKLNINTVDQCSTSLKGNEIQHKNALATSSLVPPLKFIPWIIINKVFSNENQNNAINDLKSLLCQYLKSNSKCK